MRERSPVKGASLGKEAVLADSGWAGEVTAGAGRAKTTAFQHLIVERIRPLATSQEVRHITVAGLAWCNILRWRLLCLHGRPTPVTPS